VRRRSPAPSVICVIYTPVDPTPTLPELPEGILRIIETEIPRLRSAVRKKLAQHGEMRGPKEVGGITALADHWVTIYARQLLRLLAVPYLERGSASKIRTPLLSILTDHITSGWLHGVEHTSGPRLRTVATEALADEFDACLHELGGDAA